MQWQKKWPEKSGFFWFFGKRDYTDKVNLYLGKIILNGQPHVAKDYRYIVEYKTIYKDEGAEGLWSGLIYINTSYDDISYQREIMFKKIGKKEKWNYEWPSSPGLYWYYGCICTEFWTPSFCVARATEIKDKEKECYIQFLHGIRNGLKLTKESEPAITGVWFKINETKINCPAISTALQNNPDFLEIEKND